MFCSWCKPQWNSVVHISTLFNQLGRAFVSTSDSFATLFCAIVHDCLDHDRPLYSLAMYCRLLVALVSYATLQIAALPSFPSDVFGLRSGLSSLVPRTWETRSGMVEKRQGSTNFEIGNNGSQFLWLIQDTYEGQSFFE